ncbi:unnamed protein product (macronuclear) [Paramecium tetraurelia]|uniref:Uncharacterized protein n=1 Tax=Paramecium tetraurelia TaxID=5888 RepID=A0DQF7_PARTE|nr:uncharacterized protein GSPATT00002674001 [Paramecium tetraurelia]CAK85274.1 unnamed protein product [Paramecium tetraurelia]|eukprot:XP_001452671.1 hypothetical protein (macronuclear) [Paramecium tetraurelia strain d4-2]
MNFMNTHSQFNFSRKSLPRPLISRQLTREKSQPSVNQKAPSAKFRISNANYQMNREKIQKANGNYFSQHDDTGGSTKMSKAHIQQLLKKNEIEFKQSLFDQEDKEEELQFVLLCQTIEKLL